MGVFDTIITKSALKKAIKRKELWVDGKLASTGTIISGGELIEYIPAEQAQVSYELKLQVLFEDDYLAIIYKPAGIVVSGNKLRTIANALTYNLKQSAQEDANVPKPTHRLDYPTTGLLLVGKTTSSIHALNKLFEEKRIEKTYLAICIGKMRTSGKMTSPVDGREAITSYEVLETMRSERFTYLNLVRLHPQTGRRHQLRHQLSYMGHPILGDKDYGKEGLILKGKGLYLHAQSLKFLHPFTHQEVYVTSRPPKKFQKLFPLVNLEE